MGKKLKFSILSFMLKGGEEVRIYIPMCLYLHKEILEAHIQRLIKIPVTGIWEEKRMRQDGSTIVAF